MSERPRPVDFTEQIEYAAECLLDAAKDALTQGGRPVPEIVYASQGTTVHDCEQLTVNLLQVYVGVPGEQAEAPSPCTGPITGVFQLELVRCQPSSYNLKTKSGGDPESKHEAAIEFYKDASVLIRTPSFLPTYFDRSTLADLTIGEPQGGFIPITLNVIVGMLQ